MMKLELCPCCGSEAKRTIPEINDPGVFCDKCFLQTGDYDTQEEADTAWNKRVK